MVVLSLVVLFSPSSGGGEAVFPESDKVVHLALFAGLAFTTRWRFGPVRGGLTAVLLLAPVSELVQAVALPGRSGDPYDVLADLVGAGVGWLLARRWLVPQD